MKIKYLWIAYGVWVAEELIHLGIRWYEYAMAD